MKDNIITSILDSINKIEEIVHAKLEWCDWCDKYDLVFREFKNTSKLFSEIDFNFDWYDPDMGYEDDVMALHNALQDCKPKLESFRKLSPSSSSRSFMMCPSPRFGVTIRGYCKRLEELSHEFMCDVEGVFNGTQITLKYGESAETAEDSYWSARN